MAKYKFSETLNKEVIAFVIFITLQYRKEPNLLRMDNRRNSNFELLRLIAMLMIVMYHIIAKTSNGDYVNNPGLSADAMCLHIGVICFLLITGYFSVKLSVTKVIKLGGVILFYSILVYIGYALFIQDFSITRFVASFLPITLNPDLWFIRTYFLFLLCTPLINNWIICCSKRQRLFSLFALTYISVFVGCFGNDASFLQGKNILNFCLLYLIGHEIRVHELIPTIRIQILIVLYLMLNAIIYFTTYILCGTSLFEPLRLLCWYYHSPILILNGMLLFMIFEKFKIRSSFINTLANSVFAIYLIHSNLYTGRIIWPILAELLGDSLSLFSVFLFAILIMLGCIVIDKILCPIYMSVITNVNRMYSQYKHCLSVK